MKRSACFLILFVLLIFGLPPSVKPIPLFSLVSCADDAAEYNKKLTRLEEKRVKREQKLEREYSKWLQKQDGIDAVELDKRLAKFKKELEKIQQDYQSDLARLERKAR